MSDTALIQSLQSGVDHAARQAEAKWGMGRLPLLVSSDTRTKLVRQQRRWRQALEQAWNSANLLPRPTEDALRSTSAAMERAWAALDAEATTAGHEPLRPQVWETTLKDGTVLAVVRTTADAAAVTADGRRRQVYSMDEVAALIDHQAERAPEPIKVLDGPKVGNSRADYSWVEHGDEIPF